MTDTTIVKEFIFLNNRFEVTDEFAVYISDRKSQEEKAFKIEEHYLAIKDKLLSEFEYLVQPEMKKYVTVIQSEIKSIEQAVNEGINDILGKYETNILPEIGRGLIFKYTKSDSVTVDDISKVLFVRPTALYLEIYDTFFSNAYEDIDQINAMKKGVQDRQKLAGERSNPAYTGYGYGLKGTINAAVSAAVANFGTSMIEGISDGLHSASDSSVVRKYAEQGLERVKQGLLIMGKEQVKKLLEVCLEYLFKDMQAELDALGITPFRTFTQEEQAVIDLKNENYDEAFAEGDIDIERYVAHIFYTLNEEPYNKNHYYHLAQAACMQRDRTAVELILNFADSLGLGLAVKHMLELDSVAKLPQFRELGESTLTQVQYKLSAMAGLYGPSVEREIDRLKKQLEILEKIPQARNDSARYQQLIAAGDTTAFIKPDRTVGFAGKYDAKKYKAEQLKNVIAIDYDNSRVIALNCDGTVSYSGSKILKPSTKGWNDIVSVSAGGIFHYAALRRNGTVLLHGISAYSDNVKSWRDIIAISCGYSSVVGLKADGTVVAAGHFEIHRPDDSKDRLLEEIVSSWTDIVAISAGRNHILGLKNDGTVVAGKHKDYDSKVCNVSDWWGIVAVAAGGEHSIGLRIDGTVVAAGNNDNGQCNVEEWKNMIAVSAGRLHTVGLKSDGTMEAVGYNNDGRCNLLAYRLWGK